MIRKILIVEDELIVAKDLEYVLQNAGYHICGIARSVPKAIDIIEKDKPELVLLDIHLQGKLTGIDLAHLLNEMNIAFVYLSANSDLKLMEMAKHTKPYGFMVKPFREEEIIITLDIAHYRHTNSIETEIRKEESLCRELEAIQRSDVPADETLLAITRLMQGAIPFDYLEIKSDPCQHFCGFLRIGFEEYQVIRKDGLQVMSGLKTNEIEDFISNSPFPKDIGYYNTEKFISLKKQDRLVNLYSKLCGLCSKLEVPLLSGVPDSLCLSFYSKSESVYGSQLSRFAERISPALTKTLRRVLKNDQAPCTSNSKTTIKQSSKASYEDGLFNGIVGKSLPLLSVLDFIKQVSVVDSSVLILGETGTGKEQVARNIHSLSSRSSFPLIRVNCAALPPTLIESELFGHEKGAFTDASQTRIGLFEQAQNGTIFLDEIGDIPLETQVKLLRVLQEKEVQRIGGRDIIKVDVRVIAATNKNLELEVSEGRFRMDLYYRLNVLPVYMPPLRERGGDILLLADHFLKLYGEKYNKKITGIAPFVKQELLQNEYPGNIRELENVIERSVVFAKGEFLEKIFITHLPFKESRDKNSVKTFEEVEKEHILSILSICNNKIYGDGGAAQLLNVPPSTLTSKMKKLGIRRK